MRVIHRFCASLRVIFRVLYFVETSPMSVTPLCLASVWYCLQERFPQIHRLASDTINGMGAKAIPVDLSAHRCP